MKYLLNLIALGTLLAINTCAAEEITVNYTFEGNHRIDFSSMPRGPLKVEEFTDGRSGVDARLLTNSADGYMLDRPLAEIVRDALVQGFEAGNASLVDSGENLSLAGSIVSSELQSVDNSGVASLQLTIRTRVQLRGSGRTMFETVLFGRGTAPVSEGIGPAITGALDRTIRGLVGDDYFLMEVQ